MAFSDSVANQAWGRQGGRCAKCGKELVRSNRDHGERAAWHAHHRIPEGQGGEDTLDNCVILCINAPEDCHFNFGHGGISWDHYNRIFDRAMPFLRHGAGGKWWEQRPGGGKRPWEQ